MHLKLLIGWLQLKSTLIIMKAFFDKICGLRKILVDSFRWRLQKWGYHQSEWQEMKAKFGKNYMPTNYYNKLCD